MDQNTQAPRWNIFACELEDILLAHSKSREEPWTWGHLRYHVDIHKAKVDRLRESLIVLESFPVLNPEEMDKVVSYYGLSEKEKLRLQLAIMCAGIELMLMRRIHGNEAIEKIEAMVTGRSYQDRGLRKALKIRQAVGVLQATLLEVIEGQVSHENLVASALTDITSVLKRGDNGSSLQGTTLERLLEPALDAIDQATIAIQLSKDLSINTDRIGYLRQAHYAFQRALTALLEVEDEVEDQEKDSWQIWHDEAKQGLEKVEELLEDLGAD